VDQRHTMVLVVIRQKAQPLVATPSAPRVPSIPLGHRVDLPVRNTKWANFDGLIGCVTDRGCVSGSRRSSYLLFRLAASAESHAQDIGDVSIRGIPAASRTRNAVSRRSKARLSGRGAASQNAGAIRVAVFGQVR